MTPLENLQEAINKNDEKIKQLKEVLEFPTYLLGVKEGLEWALRLIKLNNWSDKWQTLNLKTY